MEWDIYEVQSGKDMYKVGIGYEQAVVQERERMAYTLINIGTENHWKDEYIQEKIMEACEYSKKDAEFHIIQSKLTSMWVKKTAESLANGEPFNVSEITDSDEYKALQERQNELFYE